MTTEMKLYQSDDLQVRLDVLVENETVWLSQKQMAILYGTAVPAISKHIKNIFESGELQTNSRGCVKSPKNGIFRFVTI